MEARERSRQRSRENANKVAEIREAIRFDFSTFLAATINPSQHRYYIKGTISPRLFRPEGGQSGAGGESGGRGHSHIQASAVISWMKKSFLMCV